MSLDPEVLANLDTRVIDTITKHQRLEPGRVTLDSTFADLGIDSLDGIELVFEFEEAFNLTIPDDIARNMRSVRQVIDSLREVLENPESCAVCAHPPSTRRQFDARMRRVAITGVGAVSALGIGAQAFWASLVSGQSGVREVVLRDVPELPHPIAAAVQGFDPSTSIPADKQSLIDRFAQFAVAAAREAVADAGLTLTDEERERAGVSIGTGLGGAIAEDDAYVRVYRDKAQRIHPFTIPRLMYNAATAHVGMDLSLRGPSFCHSTACAASAHAIGEASEVIRSGRAEVMVAGGADAPLATGVMRAWDAMRVLARYDGGDPARACRPFSRDRQGLVVGEGSGMLVLEDWERAVGRGARIYAELAGYGATADAGHITQPGVESPVRAIRTALAQAGLNPEAIDYVNAHGTATPLNDATETTILKRVFGEHARRLAISSTKSMHGHVMGASSALELIATVLAMTHGVIPPTINYTTPDPDCDLDYVPNEARDRRVDAAISNSFAFGGLNAVLAVTRVT